MKKPLEVAWVGPKVGWGGVSGNVQGGTNSVNQNDGGDSDVALTLGCRLGEERIQQKNNDFCQHFCLGGSRLLSHFPDARQFSFTL